MQKSKRGSVWADYVKMFVVSMLSAVIVTGIWLVIAAVLLQKVGLNEKQVQMMIYMIYMSVTFAAGMIAGKWQREKKFMWGASAGCVYFLLILVLSFLTQGFTLDTQAIFPAFVCMLGGGMLGGMLA